MAGLQGSGYLATYAATKAFNRVLAESLWYEWKDKGVDIIACCAGATATPGYIRSKPGKASTVGACRYKNLKMLSESVSAGLAGGLHLSPARVTGSPHS